MAVEFSQKTPDSEPLHDYGLRRAISGLDESYRKLILLRYYGNCSCSRIAEQLEMPIGTVTKKLSRAYAKLRRSLRQQENREVRK